MGKKIKLTAGEKRIKIIDELKRFKSYFAEKTLIPLGLDQSLTRTGTASMKMAGSSNHNYEIKVGAIEVQNKGPFKYIAVAKKVNKLLKKWEPTLVAIEGYAFGTKWGREQMGELAGLIKYFIMKNKIPFLIVAPPTVKKWIGVKEKENIIKEVYKQYKVDPKNNDEADAFILMTILQSIKNLSENKPVDAIDCRKMTKQFNKRKHQVLMTVLLNGIHYPEVNNGKTQEVVYGRRIKTKKIK